MIKTATGKPQTGGDVLDFQVRQLFEPLLRRQARCEQVQQVRHPDAQLAQSGTASTLVRVPGDPIGKGGQRPLLGHRIHRDPARCTSRRSATTRTLRQQLAVLVLQTTSRSRIRPPPRVRSIAARSPVPRPAARRHRCAGWWCCRVWFRASLTMTCTPSCSVTVTCFEQCRNRGSESCFRARRSARRIISRAIHLS
jgi:hypothetical protein